MRKETLIRTVILILALVNQFLMLKGYSILPIEETEVNELISVAWTVVSALVAWWKNNSFTPEAIEADKYLRELREGTQNEDY